MTTVALAVLQTTERADLMFERDQLLRQRRKAMMPPTGPPNHGFVTPHWLRERDRVIPILDRAISRIDRILKADA